MGISTRAMGEMGLSPAYLLIRLPIVRQGRHPDGYIFAAMAAGPAMR
jgi:hypothetical protein